MQALTSRLAEKNTIRLTPRLFATTSLSLFTIGLSVHYIRTALTSRSSLTTFSTPHGALALAPPGFKQEPHNLLVIPGPIEVSDEVLYANAHPSVGHTAPAFAAVFQDCLKMIKQVLYTTSAQPFLVAGSGTLGWDMVASNLVEPGEDVLVLNSGYFGDAFADCLEVYGAKVDQVKAPIGDRPGPAEIESALSQKKYKLVTFTHVDTSTGVLSDAKAICAAVKKVSPDTLTILDGVCAVASEEIRMDDWGVDVVISASQKGLGVPPGLSVTVASERAMAVLAARKTPVTSYFASWRRWLPIMQAYGKGQAAYFATPPTNLIWAFQASLRAITEQSPSLEQRFALHKESSLRLKQAVNDLGLKQVPLHPDASANGMTAIYVPSPLKPSDIVPKMLKKGIVVAAGLHKDIKETYIRVGHLSITAIDAKRGDIDRVIKALQESFAEAGWDGSKTSSRPSVVEHQGQA
ncbi:uncharacterized protein L969DRAFT_612999 [Mixia osmundae IAM 14324]|uniref:uncharacterized protein n=1 Tax=Mixia osmundae (strain CBS 9802 / IAM 14324 / JCM 22182 / KY 12970) TaxID=764103 RepID=UPI0004A558DB|nr:uncharacterized protein L969DRAFT_612999 [Mixia osmundae IAM 14324]KEI36580.1 hypothetical protein L969DRAFT_612999 [Mixia osmundae IAM 14324]